MKQRDGGVTVTAFACVLLTKAEMTRSSCWVRMEGEDAHHILAVKFFYTNNV